ncbi:hypothetical protein BN946_scf184938.g36 [Trametes cinnabarina]|uniref:Uncharacterized protein n=1 Tax=Pycnoporus cinnabarinus TaxID=5643 RepID=A0A060S7B7_PYCCI|nr:hypothetical protein BN946_scf184938.g36 [Trametes cinnabarina]
MPSSPSPYCLTPLHGRTPPGQKGPSRFSKTFQSRIRGLEKDVDQFSAALNDFIIERTELKAMLSHEHRKDSVVEGNGHADGSSRITALLDQITKDQRALREQLDAVERGRTHREKELESEIATLRQALLDFQQEARRHSSPRREERSSTPGVVPSGNTLHAAKSLSPQISPTLTANDTHALHVEQTSDQPEADIETRRVSDNEGLTLLHADELGEQPMELATPLPTTILSLCEDDWLLPAAHPASSSAQPATDLNPADIPLPHSPQYEPTPKFMLSPRPSPTPSSPPDFPIARAAPDLTRMESTTEARIALIEREIIDTQRQLEAKEALLAGLRGPAVEPHSPSQAHDHDSHPCTDSEGPAPSPEC